MGRGLFPKGGEILNCMQKCLAGVVCLLAVVAVATVPSHAGDENDIGDETQRTLIELNETVLEEYILNNNVEPLFRELPSRSSLS